jgi:hypothetical protein
MAPGPTACKYWKQHDQLKLYRPPIVHADFESTPQPPDRRERGIMASLFGSNTDASVPLTGKIELKNYVDMGGESTYGSRGYTAEDLGKQPAIDEPFSMPLEADDAPSTQKLWLGNTKVHIECSSAGLLDLVLVLRSAKTRGNVKTTLTTPEDKEKILLQPLLAYVTVDAKKIKLAVPLATLVKAAMLTGLDWRSSPYKLELCAHGQKYPMDLVPLAWTYFHVPSATDVNMIEKMGARKILRQMDSMKLISDGGLATVEDATDEKVGALHETESEQALFNTLTLADLESKVKKAQTAGDQTALEAATTKRDAYKAHYTKEGITPEAVKTFMGGTKANVTTGDGEAERKYKGYDRNTWDQNSTSYLLWRKAKSANFMITSWGTVAILRKGTKGVFYLESLYVAETRWILARKSDDTLAMIPPTSYTSETTLRTPQRFPRPTTHTTPWKRYDFDANVYPLTGIVTQGVSSCNAGITFPNVADPDVIILSHVDGTPSVPIDAAIKRIRELDVAATRPATAAFRSIFSAHPELAEIDKYSTESLVDADLRLDYEAVLLPRDGNLWQGICNSREGHMESYGLLLPAADSGEKAKLVGVYGRPDDQLKVVDENMDLNDQGVVAKRFIDYHKGFFGSSKVYREKCGAVSAFDKSEDFAGVAKFKTRLGEGKKPVEIDRASKAKLAERRVFSFPEVGKTLYDKLAAAAKPIAETDCYLLFEKAQYELEKVDSMDTMRGLQQRLKRQAGYTGPIDGKTNDDVVAAIKRFQKSKKMAESGLADEATLNALYVACGY